MRHKDLYQETEFRSQETEEGGLNAPDALTFEMKTGKGWESACSMTKERSDVFLS
jgi:hypothetical protein